MGLMELLRKYLLLFKPIADELHHHELLSS